MKQMAFVYLLLAVSACSIEPRESELDLMIGNTELETLCGSNGSPPDIEGESFPLMMRKISTSYEDDSCGISLRYRLYTYSTAGGATNKFGDYEATYDSLFDDLEKRTLGRGQMLQYIRSDGKALVFLSQGGSSLISGSANSSEDKIQQLIGIVESKSTRLIDLEWNEKASDSP
jgi:hypothetical protein